MAEIVLFLFGLIVAPISYLVSGWALSILWMWYIVPLGPPSLTIPRAIGVSIVVGFLTKQLYVQQCHDNRSQDEKYSDALGLIVAGVIYPLAALFMGWIVYQFVG